MEKSLPSEALAAFKNSTHSVSKEMNFFIKVYQKQGMRGAVQS
jgi:hypothetical protein